MPWSGQGGGGGPWKPGNQGPWGQGPSGQQTPPDLEDLVRRSQDKLKQILPGGGAPGGATTAILVLAALALWGLSGFYTVRPDEIGVNQVFGKYVGRTGPGLNWNWPYPVGHVVKPRVTAVNAIEIGARIEDTRRGPRVVSNESLMLTGGENIVDIDFTVFWMIQPDRPQDFVFNLARPEGTIRAVAESAMREVIGRNNDIGDITSKQNQIAVEVQALMQKALDSYGAGVRVTQILLRKPDVPVQVREALNDVNAAQQDFNRLQNEARTYASQIIPAARGDEARILQSAEAFKQSTVAEAQGQAARFLKVYDEYKKAPEVTRKRLYLETMERVLDGMDKTVLDQAGEGAPVVPYLPLPALKSGGAK
jgi:membrane protease subunit HflK